MGLCSGRCADSFVPQHGSHRLDDVTGGNAVAVEQLLGFAAVGNFAHGDPMDSDGGVTDGLCDGVSDPPCRIVVLDGHDAAAGRRPRRDERLAIHGRHRIQVDHSH